MSQIETLIGGWEPETPVEDSILRQFVHAYADRVEWMASVADGWEHRPQPARQKGNTSDRT